MLNDEHQILLQMKGRTMKLCAPRMNIYCTPLHLETGGTVSALGPTTCGLRAFAPFLYAVEAGLQGKV